MKAEVKSDGRTVWVNATSGECLARFGRFGIDVHRTLEAQMAGEGQCLLCTHARPQGRTGIDSGALCGTFTGSGYPRSISLAS